MSTFEEIIAKIEETKPEDVNPLFVQLEELADQSTAAAKAKLAPYIERILELQQEKKAEEA